MSMRGKVTEKKEIKSPFGKITLETREYEQFPKRSQIIFWLGNMKIVKLGELITIYYVRKRKSNFESVKYEPFYYRVTFTDEADARDELLYHILEEEIEDILKDGLEFDTKGEAEDFAQKLKCRSVKVGGVSIGSKKEFEKWKRVMKELEEEEK